MHDRHVSICIIEWDFVHSVHSTCRNVTSPTSVQLAFPRIEPQMTWKCHTSPTSVGLPFPWIVYIPCRTLWPMKVAPSIVRQVYSCLFLELCAGFAQLWKQYTCLWGQAIKPGTETVKRKRNETKRNETKRNRKPRPIYLSSEHALSGPPEERSFFAHAHFNRWSNLV